MATGNNSISSSIPPVSISVSVNSSSTPPSVTVSLPASTAVQVPSHIPPATAVTVGSLLYNNGLNISSRPTAIGTGTTETNAGFPLMSQIMALSTLQALARQTGLPIIPLQTPSTTVPHPSNSTPLVVNQSHETIQATFNIRLINPFKKKEYETYVLRDVIREEVCTVQDFKKEICRQLGSELISSDLRFSVGYFKGNSKISINSSSDINEIWKLVSKGNTMCLWCDKLVESALSSDEEPCESTQPKQKKRKTSALEEKSERVQKIFDQLRIKHCSKYSTMQLRLWAEVIDAGTHKSLEEPPQIPMFINKEKESRTTPITGLTNAVTEMAKVMIMQCSSQQSTGTSMQNSNLPSQVVSSGVSPAKIANLRSNYLQQMRELHSLLEMGAITNQEYLEQKAPILEQLKALKPSY